jgi:CheY-like chemotaxis protein
MNGFEVLSWIRHHPLLNELKVFVWTDAGEPEVLDQATRTGANRFVPKSLVFVRGGLAGLMNGISQALAASADGGKSSTG